MSELEKGTSGIPLATRGDAQQVKVPWAYGYRGNVGTLPALMQKLAECVIKEIGDYVLRGTRTIVDCVLRTVSQIFLHVKREERVLFGVRRRGEAMRHRDCDAKYV